MEIILASVKKRHTLVYKDNVFVFFKIPEEHLRHVESALHTILNAGMKFNTKKFFFFSAAIYYF